MATIFDADVTIHMRGVPDFADLPGTVNSVELAGREVLIEIRQGPQGDPGAQGAPSYLFTWQGDAATFADLQALGLGTAEARRAWRVVDEQALYLWTGMEWVRSINAFRTPGHQGPANVLTGAAVAGATGSSASATLTGTAPNQVLTITMPRGVTGDPGDAGAAGAIADAADVGDLTGARQDSVLAWDSASSLWMPRANPRMAGPWAIASSQFTGGSNMSTSPKTLATMTIPAQPVAWRPFVLAGSIGLMCHVAALNESRIDIEIRLSSIDGPLIGYGFGVPAANESQIGFFPRFDYPLSPSDTTTAVVQPNQTVTIYVIARRVTGSRNYTVTTSGAQLIIMAQPLEQ